MGERTPTHQRAGWSTKEQADDTERPHHQEHEWPVPAGHSRTQDQQRMGYRPRGPRPPSLLHRPLMGMADRGIER